eukprot:GEMP01058884.1.p1 GENE.GEMP01058884.1~~GEMP01058884.1.p1  ORF type:complete len:401 (-),score=116.79 GEMP01058884.1:256-1458(-)
MDHDWLEDFFIQFLKSPKWVNPINEFLDNNCVVFDNEEENKLAYTDCHQKFKELVDALLTEHLREVAVTEEHLETFCSNVQEGSDSSDPQLYRLIAEHLLNVDDFIKFRSMMTTRNLEQQMEALRSLQAEQGRGEEEGDEAPDTEIWKSYEDELQEALLMSEKEQETDRIEESELQKAIALSLAEIVHGQTKNGTVTPPTASASASSAPPPAPIPESTPPLSAPSIPPPVSNGVSPAETIDQGPAASVEAITEAPPAPAQSKKSMKIAPEKEELPPVQIRRRLSTDMERLPSELGIMSEDTRPERREPTEEERKLRSEHLKKQREMLLEKKRRQREKEMEEYERLRGATTTTKAQADHPERKEPSKEVRKVHDIGPEETAAQLRQSLTLQLRQSLAAGKN